MKFVRINDNNNNDKIYMYRLLQYAPHINYITDHTIYPIVIKYYPEYELLTIGYKQTDIIYMFKNKIHENKIFNYVKSSIVNDDLIKTCTHISNFKYNHKIENIDSDCITNDERLHITIQYLNKINISWKNPFSEIQIETINSIANINILDHINKIQKLFNIDILS
jgi:hypothetical protein